MLRGLVRVLPRWTGAVGWATVATVVVAWAVRAEVVATWADEALEAVWLQVRHDCLAMAMKAATRSALVLEEAARNLAEVAVTVNLLCLTLRPA